MIKWVPKVGIPIHIAPHTPHRLFAHNFASSPHTAPYYPSSRYHLFPPFTSLHLITPFGSVELTKNP